MLAPIVSINKLASPFFRFHDSQGQEYKECGKDEVVYYVSRIYDALCKALHVTDKRDAHYKLTQLGAHK